MGAPLTSSCIFIPFHNPWCWHTDYANQTARILSKNHTVLCFLWGDAVSIKEVVTRAKAYYPLTKHGNLWKMQPLYLIPGKRILWVQYISFFLNAIAAYIICSIISIYQKRTIIFWFFGYFDPVFLLLPPMFRFHTTVYDCVDIATHPHPSLARRLKEAEQSLISHASLVVANSHTLVRRLKHIRPDVHLVPLGFRIGMFTHPTLHPLPLTKKRPVIGFIGSIDYRVNFRLLLDLSTRHPSWQFALVGPIFYDHLTHDAQTLMKRLLERPNVLHTEVLPQHIPAVLCQFSVAIIPYDTRVPLSRYAYPMKIMEYFYAQKPVIATPIYELMKFIPLIRTAKSTNDWTRAIQQTLRHPVTSSASRQMKNIARKNTWEKKLAAIQTELARLGIL